MIRNSKTTQKAIRFPNEIYEKIEKICFENDLSFTDNLLHIVENGMVRGNIMDKIQDFLNEQEIYMMKAVNEGVKLDTEVKVFERDHYQCRKCGSKDNIVAIQLPPELIGKNFAELDAKAQITLCKHCFMDMRKYIPKRYQLERFLEWYYK